MPTPFNEIRSGEWAAHTDTPKRSVFGNYRADGALLSEPARSEPSQTHAGAERGAPLQTAIDLAVARSFIHRLLAKAYEDPTPEGWRWLCDGSTQQSLRSAWDAIHRSTGVASVSTFSGQNPRDGERREGCPEFAPDAFHSFLNAYLAAFGHAARGSCPLNEIEYGDLKADPLFQPHRLADLAGFYRAFCLEIATDAGERHDHLCLELEFMCVLAAKEAYALENQLDADELALCRDAERKFLREHLGRWTPAFARRLAAETSEPTLRALASFTRAFVESECACFGVNPGGEDLMLRPVDEAAESMCASCGLTSPPPGASAAT